MVIRRLIMRNFRNYEEQALTFNRKFNFIWGNNGQGKTNILEALSLLTYGRSFLGSSESDCLMIGSDIFKIEGGFENDLGNTETVSVTYDGNQKQKSVLRNKERISSFSSEIFGRFPAVFLSPANLSITYGSPADRRRYFDIIISQASPVYLECLKDLARLLKQKSSLLRGHLQAGRYSAEDLPAMLSTFNEKLSEVSAEVVNRRMSFLREYRNFFDRSFAFLNAGDDCGVIKYNSDSFGEEPESESGLASRYLKEFEAKAKEETARGVTLCGPQRDDYFFRMKKDGDNLVLKSHASQGEHKTFLVGLKLAEYEYLKSVKSTPPVLLLDDVLSELDHDRVGQIVSHLKDYGQIFLTTADHTHIDKMKRYYADSEISAFEINEGKVCFEEQVS